MAHLYPNPPSIPPKMDQQMSVKHHLNSISYNVNHAADHVKATTKRLDALKKFAPSIAKAHAKKVLTETKEMVDKVEPYANDKEKGETMAFNTKKTGSFKGKSNAAGGGGRFAQMVASGKSPALAAFIGRKKFGKSTFQHMAAKGKKG